MPAFHLALIRNPPCSFAQLAAIQYPPLSKDLEPGTACRVLDPGYSTPEACNPMGVGPTVLHTWVEQELIRARPACLAW
jgi:hypothetical protein